MSKKNWNLKNICKKMIKNIMQYLMSNLMIFYKSFDYAYIKERSTYSKLQGSYEGAKKNE